MGNTLADYYNKDGGAITLEQWGKLVGDQDYRVIARSDLPNGIYVSTIWLGIDHRIGRYDYSQRDPIIFESMAFAPIPPDSPLKLGRELDQKRYATLRQAKAGHNRMVAKYMKEGASGDS